VTFRKKLFVSSITPPHWQLIYQRKNGGDIHCVTEDACSLCIKRNNEGTIPMRRGEACSHWEIYSYTVFFNTTFLLSWPLKCWTEFRKTKAFHSATKPSLLPKYFGKREVYICRQCFKTSAFKYVYICRQCFKTSAFWSGGVRSEWAFFFGFFHKEHRPMFTSVLRVTDSIEMSTCHVCLNKSFLRAK
jgi:hypothetical protein